MFYTPGQEMMYVTLELTTKCNAACPMCARNQGGDIINGRMNLEDFNVDWIDNLDIATYKYALTGNYGDPTLHPRFHEIVKRLNSKNDNVRITVMTNGGARSPGWWKELGEMAVRRNRNKFKVIFGIDGLEDTNHLYRRNVRWDRLMENAKAYIDAGGVAHWKFILFKHNQHQIEQAKELAEKMGFAQFEQIRTNRFENGPKLYVKDKTGKAIYYIEEPGKVAKPWTPSNSTDIKPATAIAEPIDTSKEASIVVDEGFVPKNSNRLEADKSFDGTIKCYAKADPSLYIAADGRVYPCCNLAYHYNGPYVNNIRQIEVEQLQNETKEWHIGKYPLHQIINGDFFNAIKNRWPTNPLEKCIKTCGKARDNLWKIEKLT